MSELIVSHVYVPDAEYMDGIREATVPEVLAYLQQQNVGEEVESKRDDFGFRFLPLVEHAGPGRYLVVPLDPKEGN